MKTVSRVARARVGRAVAAAASRLPANVYRQAIAAVPASRLQVAVHARTFATLPAHTPMKMPALSPTMATGNIAKWCKQEGDALNPGDVIAEVETDKATVDFECQDSGYLAKIIIPGGTNDVPVGKVVAIIVDSKEAADAFKSVSSDQVLAAIGGGAPAPAVQPAAAAAPAPVAAAPVAAAPAPVAAPSTAAAAGGRVIATPYAKKLASDAGINIAAVAGTGPGGRVVAADIKEYKPPAAPAVQAAAAVPAAAAEAKVAQHDALSLNGVARAGFVDVPHSQMRRVIAHRLTASKQTVPHYYLTADVCLDGVLTLRAQLNEGLKPEERLSVNDFLIKASALACKKVPEVNSSWLDSGVRAYDYVDISVAVAIPDGLVTPIVRDAQNKGLTAISSSVKSLVEKARAKKLSPEEYQGGTFTISNLGMYGIRQFAAIINPPQAAILAVGSAERRVVPDTTPGAAMPYKTSVYLAATCSFDHRVVDGAVGAQWLSAFKGYLENPQTMLL